MATLLEASSEFLTPDKIGAIGKALGMDSTVVERGMKVADATVLGSLANMTSNADGADALMKMLPKEAPAAAGAPAKKPEDMLGDLLGSLSGGAGGTSADMMNNVLGDGVGAISGTLSQKLGFDVKPILMMAVPLVIGQLNKMIQANKMDAAGVSKLLKDESQAYMADPANKETTDIVMASLKAGDEATALRKKFSDADWMSMRMAPIAAVYMVINVSKSGSRKEENEAFAAVTAVAEALSHSAPASLLGSAFGGGLNKSEIETLKNAQPTPEKLSATLQAGMAAVRANAPGDAEAYRTMILDAATRSAEAEKEGGFLGIGGTRVSKEEQAALETIRGALA